MENINPILDVDSYKHSHYLQYPPNTQRVYSYVESRGGEYDKLVFFGLQIFLKRYMNRVPTKYEVDIAQKIVTEHGLPFNRKGWDELVALGYWPVEIKALPEGMVVPTGIPVATIENTDDRFYWITSFLETAFLRAIWYPSTVATISYHARETISEYLDKTCDLPDWRSSVLPFRLHDFGARGVSSYESAYVGGLAHLTCFMGTDTMPALVAAMEIYNASGVVGFSIPAAEHSTITSWGETREVDAYRNMVKSFSKGAGLYAVVSDSYDIINAVNNIWGNALKWEVEAGDATLVVRPDSGVPAEVVVQVLDLLGLRFGYTRNTKGYKVLNPKVRVIQGDGINSKSIRVILEAVKKAGWSTENLAMGMGGQLLQGLNRDTLKWAMKCSAIMINNVWFDVFKNPKTDPGKASKKGRFAVVSEHGVLKCYPEANHGHENLLRRVYKDGKLYVDHDFNDVRRRVNGDYVDLRKAA